MGLVVRFTAADPCRALHTGPARPMANVQLRSGKEYFKTLALVDSGADNTLFHRDFALPREGVGITPDGTRPPD
ncbi:MAG: hypothetical protein ACYDGR_10815 [Candidatus Dormibacteria bacterium]